MRKNLYFRLLITLILSNILILGCNKKDNVTDTVVIKPIQVIVPISITMSGNIEKGPFIPGSNISFYELDSSLNQTGKSYTSTINDIQGKYELKFLNIPGRIFRIQSDGFYFNEVLNTLSTSRIVLQGISRIDSTQTVNINILTELERRRVEYLISSKSLTFEAAKKQAITELLNIFKVSSSTISSTESTNLFGSNGAILLSLSVLFQGYRTDAQLSELLTDFSNDFYNDGTLENITIFKRIYNHGLFIDTASVASNIKDKFNIGVNSFSILSSFLIDNISKKDETYMPISYPLTYNGKRNFLTRVPFDTVINAVAPGCLMYTKNNIANFDLKVIVKSLNPTDSSSIMSRSQSDFWVFSSGSGWSSTEFLKNDYGNQTFSAKNITGEASLKFWKGKYDIFFFEPATSKNPTFVKRITVY